MHHNNKLLTGFLSLIICTLSYFAFAHADDKYYHFTKAYSELGAAGQQYNIAFSILGFLVPGLLVAYFSMQLRQVFNHAGKFPFIMLALSGVLIALAASPMDYDNFTTPASTLHIVGSLASGFFFIIGAVALNRILRRDPNWKPISVPLLLLLTVMIVSSFFRQSEVPGLAQKVGILSYYLYIAVLSVHAYRLSLREISKLGKT